MQSPLSHLADVLTQVREAAKSYKPQLMKNEAATRAALVDPVLRALGWDVANPDMVEVERTEKHGAGIIRADYALFSNNVVKFVIEAKTLSENLLIHRKQVVDYAYGFKISSVFLTDGLIWEHYTRFDPTNLVPTKVLNLASDDLSLVAAYLVQELDAAIVSPQAPIIDQLARKVEQLEEELQELRNLNARLVLLEKALQLPPPATPAPQPLQTSANWIPLTTLVSDDVKGKQPSELRLPDGTVIPVRTWTQVLVEGCKYALRVNPGLPIPFPDKAGRRVNLISSIRPPSNVTSAVLQSGATPLFAYTNYDANTCLANTLHVLSQISPSNGLSGAAIVLRT